MKQINISITQVCAFQSMKSLDDGTASHDSNYLVPLVNFPYPNLTQMLHNY